jgi:TRAP-type mannitol/chloroaromatic compound transport system permease large subunit
MPGGATGAVLIVMAVMFVLGFFLDTFEIILIMLPICGGPLILLGVDPIWLGVMVGLNLQTSFLTPPFGYTLFYIRGLAPRSIRTTEIWAGAVPFVGLQVIGLVIVWVFPALATWLPGVLLR